MFAVQDEIAQSIAAIIEPTIDHDERQRIKTKPASDINAWDLCLRGFANLYEVTAEANTIAIDQFKRATELDPTLARAHSGLAYAYIRDRRFFRTLDPDEMIRLSATAARQAVQLDEMDAEAHAMLARALMSRRELEPAIAEAKRSTELNPFDPFAHNTLGVALALGGSRYEEGIPSFERALQLSPLDPQQFLYLTQLALAEIGAQRYNAAIQHARDALRRNPDFFEAQIALAAAAGFSQERFGKEYVTGNFQAKAEKYVREHNVYSQALKNCLLDGLEKTNSQ